MFSDIKPDNIYRNQVLNWGRVKLDAGKWAPKLFRAKK
jgi:hypothetical protein